MNTIILTETVGAIAAKDYRKAEVFRKMGIDFCYDGDKSLEEASRDAGVSAEQLNAALCQVTIEKTDSSQQFDKWNLVSVIDYIINTHHRYAKENAVIIYDLAQKVASHHGANHPELIKLATAIFLFLHDLLNHMKKEEEILFPAIKQLIRENQYLEKSRYTTSGLIKGLIRLMREEHHATSKYLKLFHELTNDYMLPEDACSSYRNLFEKLKEFEDDLLLHVHLENNILFPKALVEYEELNKMYP